MTKQTAVEWLETQIDNELKVINNLYGKEIIGRKIAFAFVKRILIEAKEMEKLRMILFACDVHMDIKKDRVKSLMELVEEMYNETHGGNND